MNTPIKSSKTRLKVTLAVAVVLVTALTIRLGYLQIYKGDELRKGALEQWTKSIDIKPDRGIIYDRKGNKLAVSVNSFTVYAYPADIKQPEETALTIAEVLDMDVDLVYEKLTKKVSSERIKQWITREEANELRQYRLSGISIIDDTKRYYPNGNFAAHILGFTNIDNIGLTGIERIYDNYLTGVPGKWLKMTDAANRQLPYDGEKVHEPIEGTSLVLTIDETIQHFAEKAAQQALLDNKAKNVSIIIMEPKSADVLAMVSKPDFDLNNPREPLDEQLKAEWADLPTDQLQDKWNELWRNFNVNDIYEPGSTFKLITAAAALEENTTNLNHHYFCGGTIKVSGRILKCARWYNPHGSQSLREAMNNSCNVAFVNIGSELGKEKFYEYLKAFGFGQKTDVDLLGEQRGLIPSGTDVIKDINLATMSYGHGVAITPLQLVNAVSAITNGGYLMKPRLVKELIDFEGNVITTYEPEVKKQVISKETSDTMLSMMETVVSEGSGSRAKVAGYRVGGKTGTAQKIIDGRYASGKYIGSFIGVAPIDDPQVVILVIVDEPSAGTYYGGSVAAPVAQSILEEIFNYLEIPPQFSEDELDSNLQKVAVPDIKNLLIGEAGKTLTDLGLRYTTEYLELTNDSTVIDQFPAPGVEVQKGSIIDLYLNYTSSNIGNMPYLINMTKDEAIKTLNEMNLEYTLTGEGIAVEQNPLPGEEITTNTKVSVEFK